MLKIVIETKNAIFQEHFEDEIERILKELIGRIKKGFTEGFFYDVNGNRCGHYFLDK